MEQFLQTNWQWLLIGFFVAEKLVLMSPAKWDDILVSGIIKILKGLKASTQKRY